MKLAIHGAAGRMGQRVTALAAKDPRFQIVAALESANHPLLGKDAGLIAGVGEIGVPLGVVGESRCRRGDRLLGARCRRGRRRPLRRVHAAGGDRHDRPRSRSAGVHPQGGQEDSDRLVAQHEHGRQRGDEAHRDRRQGARAICRPASTSKSSSATTASRKTRPAARR